MTKQKKLEQIFKFGEEGMLCKNNKTFNAEKIGSEQIISVNGIFGTFPSDWKISRKINNFLSELKKENEIYENVNSYLKTGYGIGYKPLDILVQFYKIDKK